MGKAFFTEWLLWQKMTFVLACGIAATFIVGLIKVQIDKYRLRKYSQVEKGKRAQTPDVLEAQPMSTEPKDEIPFGIRAIESGIEVDGVWISRSNTPVGSSRSSMTEVKLNNSQLELPKAVHGVSSRDSSRAPFDRATSAERIPANESRSSSPGRGNPPISYNNNHNNNNNNNNNNARYNSNNATRNSMTLQTLEGFEARSPSSARYAPNNVSTSSSNSNKSSTSRNSDESDYMALSDNRPYEAAYINPRHYPSAAPFDPRTDLDLLQSHRLSHVAETGQLTPRVRNSGVRRPGNNGEWASVSQNISPQEVSTANGVDYFAPKQKTPSLSLPPEDVLPPSVSRYNQDGYTSNQARQAIPLLETYAPQATRMPQAYEPRGPQHEYDDDAGYEVQTNQNQRQSQSQVLRKVNSGFEILRPGTLGEPPSPEDDKTSPTSEKRRSKRLQKKRTSSNASRTSHFVEQV